MPPRVSTVERMAGRKMEIVPAFTKGDSMPDLSTASAAEIKAWKAEKHLGSPTSILFFTQEQLQLWNQRKVLFMADYSTGKTTLLKSKAESLAQAGESVTLIFMGGSGKTEAVMSIANKLDFDPIKYPTITVLSQQDLEEMHPWRPWTPSPLSLLKFYIEKEKPQHLMVDEVPFERSTLKQLLTLQHWIFVKLVSRFGFMMGAIMFGIIFASIPILVELLNGGTWSVVITYIILASWRIAGRFVNPIDLDKTSSMLNSLPPLFSNFSFLWIALHSSPLTDSSIDSRATLSRDELEKWKRRLAPAFTIPELRHNLRNSNEVASIRGFASATLGANQSEALPTAPAPRPPPTLPATPVFQPIHLPVCTTSQLGEAVKHAYVTSLGKPKTLVVLLADISQQDVVKTSLSRSGLSVVTYTNPEERTACKTFLENPVGALVTTPQLFSGMEAAAVIWVKYQTKIGLERSSQLRAIHKLSIIDTGSSIDGSNRIGTGVNADGTFAKCHMALNGALYRCKSCKAQPILLCRHCVLVCHQSCEREFAELRSILHLFLPLYNPCSCKSSGPCQLKHPPRTGMPLWIASAAFFAIVGVLLVNKYL